MYSNENNFNKMKHSFFESMKIESIKCMEPTETCTETDLIASHSVQDSRILEELALDQHVIQIGFDTSCVGKSTLSNRVEPTCKFDSVSIHKATTFIGLCNKHDTELFLPIDTEILSMENEQHVFLLTYRAVMKELAASKKAAVMNQSMFLSKVDLGEVSGDIPSIEGLMPVLFFERAYEFNEYKKMFDADYLSHTYSNIVSKHLIFVNPPTFAASSVFTPLELSTKENEPERICINIFPYNGKMYVLFSCRREDERYMNLYIDEIMNANEAYQKYLISKLVLRNCGNIAISPSYFNSWSSGKKAEILSYFKDTMKSDLSSYENLNLYLF